MFKGSAFCAKCGAEAAREIIEDEKELPCPRCKVTLQALQLGAIHVRECTECGGLWLTPIVLQTLCAERERHGAVVATLASHVASKKGAGDVVRYIPCPACTKLMNRTNFAHVSGVIVDVCRTDGIWLDRGELEQIIRFIESGGLQKERQRETERLTEETKRLKAMQAGSRSSYTEIVIHTHGFHRHPAETSVDGVLSALASMFTT